MVKWTPRRVPWCSFRRDWPTPIEPLWEFATWFILTPKIDRLIERLLDHDRPDDVRPTLRTFDTELLVHHAVQSRSRPPCGQDRPADTGETIYPRNGRGGRQAEWTILAESCRADFGLR